MKGTTSTPKEIVVSTGSQDENMAVQGLKRRQPKCVLGFGGGRWFVVGKCCQESFSDHSKDILRGESKGKDFLCSTPRNTKRVGEKLVLILRPPLLLP